MDRDQRWDRQRLAWDAIVEGVAEQHADDALAALDAAYARGEHDEFVTATVIGEPQPMTDGDAVVYMNFLADRARQLAAALVSPGSDCFPARRPALLRFTRLTQSPTRY